MKSLTRARLTVSVAALAAGAGACAASPLLAQAATLKVCASGCPYTQIAPALAAAHSGDWIRIFPGTYSEGGLEIHRNVTLSGAGPAKTIISGGSPAVTIDPLVKVRIRALAITGGSSSYGGGVFNFGRLRLEHVALSHNVAFVGGGIYNGGTLKLEKSTLGDNLACFGGGLVSSIGGKATLDHAHVNANHAVFGGGLVSLGGALTVRESVLTANAALSFGDLASEAAAVAPNEAEQLFGPCAPDQDSPSDGGLGGGVYNSGNGTVVLEDDTIVKQGTAIEGGGVFNDSGSSLVLRDSVVKLNSATGGPGSGGGVLNAGTIAMFDGHIRHNAPDDCVDSGGGTGC